MLQRDLQIPIYENTKNDGPHMQTAAIKIDTCAKELRCWGQLCLTGTTVLCYKILYFRYFDVLNNGNPGSEWTSSSLSASDRDYQIPDIPCRR